MRLWDIDSRVEELEAALSSLEDGSEDALALLEAELDAAQNGLASKLDSCAALIQALSATAKARKEEADRLTKLAKSDQARADRLRAFVLSYLQARGRDKFETPRFRIAVALNGGVAPLEILVPAEELPEGYQRKQVLADTEAIRNALEAGESLEWARLGERGTSLRIR